jgi:TolB-like protein/Tfp pilus assembly protein PilF
LQLLRELQRRNVFRVAIGYIISSWLLIQVADLVLENIGAPDWVMQSIMLVLALGFPVAVFFSWAYEVTPEGLKRESEVDRTQSITHVTRRKLDRAIMAMLVVALGYFIWESRFAGNERGAEPARDRAQSAHSTPGAEASPNSKSEATVASQSIAVLPFVNMSSDPEQEYFSDGLSEELLNLLAKIPELKVASRSSAFQFKGEKIDLTEVAQKLKVAYVLEGSVRKAGDQLRITTQLIKADDGYHLWSETYDRSLDNIFAIQDEISAAVVEALKIELLGEAPKAVVVDPEAYALVLKARYLYARWGKENFAAAAEAYHQALAIDPDYAEAWAGLSVTYLSQTQSGYLEGAEGLVLARDAVDRAVALDPKLASAWARLSLIQSVFEWDWAGAERSLQTALELAPNDGRVLGAAGNFANIMGLPDKALAYYQQILVDDPLDMVNLYNAADILHRQGRLQESEVAFRNLLELNPDDWGSHTQLAIIMLQQDRPQEAWDELELEVDPQQQEYGRILALYALNKEEEAGRRLHRFAEENQAWAAFLIATIHAWKDDPDNAFAWLDRAYQQRDGWMTQILNEPLFAGLRNDPRWVDQLDRLKLQH